MHFDKYRFAPIAAAIALFATPVGAQEIEHGTAVICDTVEQIDTLVQAKEDGKNPMAVVNAEKPVCGVGNIAYVKGEKIKELSTKEGVLEVFAILWVGTSVQGMFRAVKPEKQFTIFPADGENI